MNALFILLRHEYTMGQKQKGARIGMVAVRVPFSNAARDAFAVRLLPYYIYYIYMALVMSFGSPSMFRS